MTRPLSALYLGGAGRESPPLTPGGEATSSDNGRSVNQGLYPVYALARVEEDGTDHGTIWNVYSPSVT